MTTARLLVAELGDLILPRRCVSCARPGPALCELCAPASMPFAVELPVENAAVPVYAAGPYEDALRTAVLAYKERGRRDVGRALGPILAEVVATLVDLNGRGPFALAPVPSSRAAARQRGGQHVLRLARDASRRLELPVAPGALRLRRAVRDSAGLDIETRRANLAGALSAVSPPGDIGVIVIDDIVTTGATLIESVRALRAAGWRVVGAAVLAATPRRFPRPTLPITSPAPMNR